MENYKINKSLGFVRLPFNLTSDYDDSMKDIRKASMVKSVLDGEVQKINDYEMTAFRSQYQTLIFDFTRKKKLGLNLMPMAPRQISYCQRDLTHSLTCIILSLK